VTWSYRSLMSPAAAETAAKALDAGRLEPLAIEEGEPWDPEEIEWDDLVDLPAIFDEIRAAGPRPELRMESVVPFDDPSEHGTILSAIDRFDRGDVAAAEEMLHALLATDVRCLDAHAHLGTFAFDRSPELALERYEQGAAIAERSIPGGFGGVIRWGWLENRPFLRCLHGLGLCLWRLRRFEEAGAAFEAMVWLNPGDNQGASACLAEVRASRPWRG